MKKSIKKLKAKVKVKKLQEECKEGELIMYCPNCNSEVESIVRTVSETYPVKGENITIEARVRFCKCCNEDIWDDELDEQNLINAFAEYRKKHHLLQPAEIRTIREKYGLSQVAFARVLGLGDKTITRYENGSIADAAQNNLIELVRQPSNFKELLEKNKDKITEQDIKVACEALESMRPKIIYNTQRDTYSTSMETSVNYSMTRAYWGDQMYA